MRFLLALLMLSVLSDLATAAQLDESGNVFIEECSAYEKATSDMSNLTTIEILKTTKCGVYLTGVIDGVKIERSWLGGGDEAKYPVPFCLPPEVPMGQVLRITLKYIRNNPELAHHMTVELVVRALNSAFPCTDTPPKKE